MRYFIRMSYDGSKFHGFQRLPKERSVQKALEDVLSKINNAPVFVKGAGRTDAGVHAMGQCAHFDMDCDFDPEKLQGIMNRMLDPYLAIWEVKKVDASFHARFDVLEKEYEYQIYFGTKNPFLEDYALYFPYTLDVERMKEGAALFIGLHDFHNFVGGERRDYRCVLQDIKIEVKEDRLYLRFYGKSFYRYMVRKIVGALLLLGREKISLQDIMEALEMPNVRKEFWTAPSKGLYLKKIVYSF